MLNKNGTFCCTCDTTHIAPSGKGSLLEISEILTLHSEGIKIICTTEERLLRARLNDITSWMITLPTWDSKSIYDLLCTYKEAALAANRNTDGEDVGMYLINCSDMANRDQFSTDEYMDAYRMYEDELENIATKASYTSEAKLHWYKAKLEVLNTELKLHDTIQDKLDAIPDLGKWTTTWAKYVRACFKRLDELFRAKSLSFDGWYLFSNQLRTKVGMKLVKHPEYDLSLLPDRISYYENKMEKAKLDMWEEKELVSGIRLETEDIGELIELIEETEDKLLTA